MDAAIPSSLSGDKISQIRARAALPILVRQAKAEQSLQYGELAEELMISNPRTLDWPLGAIGKTIQELSDQWGEAIPPIQALVVNKSTGLPGLGIAWFADDAVKYKAASPRERRLIVKKMMQDVYAFRAWDRVLRELGLREVPARSLPTAKSLRSRGGGGEGEEHRALKKAIAKHPEWLGLPKRMAPGEIEHPQRLGDSLDVFFHGRTRWVAVEVKGESAPESEMVRGLFQCVKYQAVLTAEARAGKLRMRCEAILALGGQLPQHLIGLRNTLGVIVKQGVGARAV